MAAKVWILRKQFSLQVYQGDGESLFVPHIFACD
jgi:hypothetical protein